MPYFLGVAHLLISAHNGKSHLENLWVQRFPCQRCAEIENDDNNISFGQDRVRISKKGVAVMLFLKGIHDSRCIEENQLRIADGGDGQRFAQCRVDALGNADA